MKLNIETKAFAKAIKEINAYFHDVELEFLTDNFKVYFEIFLSEKRLLDGFGLCIQHGLREKNFEFTWSAATLNKNFYLFIAQEINKMAFDKGLEAPFDKDALAKYERRV